MGRKKKGKKAASGPKGAPEWVVTFTDMISLLVTFFVLLMTFSSMEEYDMVKIDAWLFGKRGVLDSRGSAMAESPESDLVSESDLERGSSQPHVRPSEALEENLVEMGQKKSDAHQELSFDEMPDGLVLEFGEAEAFAPGSAQINGALAKALGEIGRVLEHYRHMIVFEGFTDESFQPNARYRSAEALAFARAQNAAQFMLANSNVVPERLQIAGLGAQDPRGSSDTALERTKNRRVQVRILSISSARAIQLGEELR